MSWSYKCCIIIDVWVMLWAACDRSAGLKTSRDGWKSVRLYSGRYTPAPVPRPGRQRAERGPAAGECYPGPVASIRRCSRPATRVPAGAGVRRTPAPPHAHTRTQPPTHLMCSAKWSVPNIKFCDLRVRNRQSLRLIVSIDMKSVEFSN